MACEFVFLVSCLLRECSNSNFVVSDTNCFLEIYHRRSACHKHPHTNSIEKQKLQCLEKAAKSKEKVREDEDLQFFESLLPHVRKIAPENKLLFRNRVQQLVQDYAYGVNQRTRYTMPLAESTFQTFNYDDNNHPSY